MLADASLVAAPAAIVFNETATVLAPTVLVAIVAAGALRKGTFVPPIAVIAFTVVAATMRIYERPFRLEPETLWIGLQGLMLAALVVASRLDDAWVPPTALAVAGAGSSASLWLLEAVELCGHATELTIGAVFAALLGLATWQGLRGLALGSAVVLAVDAIVFAFDIGGVLVGVGTLVGLALVAIWQAETRGGYLRKARDAT